MNVESFTSSPIKALKLVVITAVFVHSTLSFSQNLSAVVLNYNNEPIKDVKVFYDKTSVFTYTDGKGGFILPEIPKIPNLKMVLFHPEYKVYETFDLQVPESKFYLDKQTDNPKTSEVDSGLFSKEDLYVTFKENFIGNSENAKDTFILKKDDITIWFNESTQTLCAEAPKPLHIQNKALGYDIEYYLIDFKIEYSTNKLHPEFLDHTSLYGYTLFKDVDNTRTKDRQKAYQFTTQNFFKQIINKNIRKTKFKILVDNEEKDPENLFSVSKTTSGFYKLSLSKEQETEDFTLYVELYYRRKSSRILLYKPYIIVDKYGNIINRDDIEISGSIVEKKLADMLPLEYYLNNKS